MSSTESQKRRIYIVGGKGKNVPPWIDAAFAWEQFEQDHSKTRTLDPANRPDAVVVLSSWVGHEHFYGARDLAERLDIPMILSPGGWSASLKAAAELGINWFISDIERSRSSGVLTESQVEDLDSFIDNAWREAYQREWAAREALAKRYTKDRSRLEHVERELTRLEVKEAAAQRVIAEIRAAAKTQREEMERHNSEIQDRSSRIADALSHHISTMKELFESVDDAHLMLIRTTSKVSGARSEAQAKMDFLRASLQIAEEGVPANVKGDPVSASNAGTDS